jgi:hypothetical protein
MQEPAACGTLPAQHASLHIEPADTDASGTTLDRHANTNTTPSTTLAALTARICSG